MDATTTFLADVTVALIAGSIAGALARALRITPIVGYLLAGVAIGPFTPGYVAQGSSLSGLAELGLIFLLFSLGLGFSLPELLRAGGAAVAGNLVAMAGTAAAVWLAASKLGMVHPVTLALAFTVSSTAVGAAILQMLGVLERRSGRMALSLLITQDLIAVMVLVIISTPASSLTVVGVGVPLLRAVAFVAVALILGATVLHRLFDVTLRRAGSELLVVIFSAVALTAAWLGHLAGLTFEFGAFVAGAVTSEAAGSRIVENVVRPFRQLFVMLFFVSMGTLVDLSSAAAHWQPLLAIAAAAVLVRWLLWNGVARAIHFATFAPIAIALLPMGEFNIVLGSASFAAGRLNRPEMALLVGSSVLSIVIAALFARAAQGRSERAAAAGEPLPVLSRARSAVIVGYGRVGRTVARMLKEDGVSVAVVELDPSLVRRAQAEGFEAVYGDGGDPQVLEHVVAPDTAVVFVSSPVPEIEGARAFGRAVSKALRKDGGSTDTQH